VTGLRMRLPAALLILMLGACASIEPVTETSWDEQRSHLDTLTEWRASGKIALKNAGASESGYLEWSQQGERSVLSLSGPAGLNATTIDSNGRQLAITRGDQREYFDISSPESIRTQTGWDLPLAALPFWIKGLPAPQIAVDTRRIQQGLLRELQQGGWQLLYSDYGRFDSYSLPTRLELSRGDTRARLVIRRWQTGKPE
jgi:outer membrane lipoprotein LolB